MIVRHLNDVQAYHHTSVACECHGVLDRGNEQETVQELHFPHGLVCLGEKLAGATTDGRRKAHEWVSFL